VDNSLIEGFAMDSFAPKIISVGIASILCGIALAGGGKDDHMKMMDTNSDGKVTAAEHADGCKQMFTKMDANSDGRVTAAEMDAAHPMMKHHKDAKDATTARNEDGHDKENAADKSYDQSAKMRGGKMMSSSEKIAVMDTNSDGQLSAQEHATGAKKMFTKMDKDGDSTLTAQELREGHRTMMTASDSD
jgi:Ca2+-binding EF-hand superfamily protein